MVMAIVSGLMEQNLIHKVAVVILAGGKSSRMGNNKALLADPYYKGRDLLKRAFEFGKDLLTELSHNEEDVYVSGNYKGYKCIDDIFLNAGPLGGIHAALTYMIKENKMYRRLIFIPVDMPALKPVTILRLISETPISKVSSFKGCELPVVIPVDLYTQRLLTHRLEMLKTAMPDLSVKGFLQTLGALTFKLSDAEQKEFINVNAQYDYKSWASGMNA
jgi:molybdenum cofactor guanylyltransferase